MKAERRHELRENDLLHAIQVGKDYLRDNSGRVSVVCIVVIVAAAAVSFGIRSRAAAHEDVYRRMDLLSFDSVEAGRESLDSLATMIRESTDDEFILKGRLEQGRQALRLAQEVHFPPDVDLNAEARRAFEGMLARFPDNPLATGIALNGLATVEENEFAYDEDFSHKEKAREHLTAVVGNPLLTGMTFQRIALDRLDTLDETFTTVTMVAPTLTPEELEALEAEALEVGALEETTEGDEAEGESEGEGPTDPAPTDAAIDGSDAGAEPGDDPVDEGGVNEDGGSRDEK